MAVSSYIKEQIEKINRPSSREDRVYEFLFDEIKDEIKLKPFDRVFEIENRCKLTSEDVKLVSEKFSKDCVNIELSASEEYISIALSGKLMAPLTYELASGEFVKLPVFYREIISNRQCTLDKFFGEIIEEINLISEDRPVINNLDIDIEEIFITDDAKMYIEKFLSGIDMKISKLDNNTLTISDI